MVGHPYLWYTRIINFLVYLFGYCALRKRTLKLFPSKKRLKKNNTLIKLLHLKIAYNKMIRELEVFKHPNMTKHLKFSDLMLR